MVIFHFANCQRLPEANSPYHHKQTMVFVGDISILFLWFICTNCSITGVHHTIVSIDISPAKTIVLGVICTHQLSVNSSLGHHLAIPSQPLRVVCVRSLDPSQRFGLRFRNADRPQRLHGVVFPKCVTLYEKKVLVLFPSDK